MSSRPPGDEALAYHASGRPGKLEVTATKPCVTQRDLSLAYTPGVARPCLRIRDDAAEAYRYTAKGNLVAVISNGTAVLGLGNIGALAGKPVMEGKAVLFKRFADIDVFDLEVATEDPAAFVEAVRLLEPTFGGINLEDIRAPECFEIEEALTRLLSIPVMHDDQHGTAIISGAALLNALEVAGKRIDEIKVVFNGAGAAGLACARYYLSLGVRRENLVLCDKHGVVWKGRQVEMDRWKATLATDTDLRTLDQVVRGADVLVGLSVGGCFTPAMLRSMNERPIVFAMANPDPEIAWEVARETRGDLILATGRSDHPNQVNNVLGFPFIFRGALDVRASSINEPMKLAATRALAQLAREDVPDSVVRAYGVEKLRFGPDYLIPKPFDHRVLLWEATAVAEAAMASGVARQPVDLEEYRDRLESRLGRGREVMRVVIHQARRQARSVVFPQGTHPKVLQASHIIADEGIARPILLGSPDEIRRIAADMDVHLDGVTMVDPSPQARAQWAEELYRRRHRKGVTRAEATRALRSPTVCAAMMVALGEADALVAGVDQHYPETLRPALQILGTSEGVTRVCGVYLMVLRDRVLLLGDATVNIEPTAEDLAEIAILAARAAHRFHIEPRIAMLSFSNFGSVSHPLVAKVRRAVEIVRRRAPDLAIDGEMQADTAVSPELIREHFPFCELPDGGNVLVFPDLQSANAAYKLLSCLGGAEAIGPILLGMRRPVHLLQHGAQVRDIVNAAAIAAVDAQEREHEEALATTSLGELVGAP